MRMSAALLVISGALATGCATMEPFSTTSGFPEAVIHADKAAIKNAIVANMVAGKWGLTGSDEYKVDFNKHEVVMFPVAYVKDRYSEFMLLDESGAVRVIAKLGTNKETFWTVKSPEYDEIEAVLSKIKSEKEQK